MAFSFPVLCFWSQSNTFGGHFRGCWVKVAVSGPFSLFFSGETTLFRAVFVAFSAQATFIRAFSSLLGHDAIFRAVPLFFDKMAVVSACFAFFFVNRQCAAGLACVQSAVSAGGFSFSARSSRRMALRRLASVLG